MANKVIDLAGKKFGHLTVLERDKTKEGKPQWVCRCDCGNRKTIRGAALKSRQQWCSNECSLRIRAGRIDSWAISRKDAPPAVRKAYKSWCDQRQRCTNPNDPRYQWWGGKGIQVEYTSDEFVRWWVEEEKRKGPFKRANCSRIDHTKNYSLDNIELMECAINSKERIDRAGPPKHGYFVIGIQLLTGQVRHFKSAYEAGEMTKVAKSVVLNQLKAKFDRTIRCGWVFIKANS